METSKAMRMALAVPENENMHILPSRNVNSSLYSRYIYIFEKTEEAEKKERKKTEKSAFSREQLHSPPESAVLDFAAAANYRVPILDAPASYFEDFTQIDSERNVTISPEEALQRLESGTLSLVRSSLLEGPHINFTSGPPMKFGAGPGSLQFHVDLDSLDFVTISLGGTAFNMSNASIPFALAENIFKGTRNRRR